MFFFCRAADAEQDVRSFAEAGIDAYSGCFGLPGPVRLDGNWDLAPVRRAFDAVIRGNPKVLILPRVILGWFLRPEDQPERFEAERQLNRHPATGKLSRTSTFSFSSEVWKSRGAEALREFLRFCEQEYGDHILGYHLAAGASGEWAYSWEPALSDASEPQRKAFADWLQRRYPDQRIDPATVTIPLDRTRQGTQPLLLEAPRDQRTIDYLMFHSEAAARAILHFAQVAKATLRELNREKICGAFYGYHFKNMNRPANYCNEGHFAQELLLRSPAIDFFCAPYCYTGRESGHMYNAQLCAATLRLHGKLYLCEEDTFTFKAKRESNRHVCRTREETIGVFRRNLMGILREGGGAWYMDCGGNGPLVAGGQVDGWYRDEGLMRNFAAMQRLATEVLQKGDRGTDAEVALIVSDDGAAYLRQDESLIDALVFRQLLELSQMGAPFDCYRLEDLPRLMEQPWAQRYRLLLFVTAFAPSARVLQSINTALKRDGRSLVFMYAPGLITPRGFSTEAMRELTGLRLNLRRQSEHLLASCTLLGPRLLYGTERHVSPIIAGDDPEAQVHGTFLNTGDPAFLIRDFGTWRSVWSGAPCLPAAVLRHLARQAGAHLFCESGDQVLTLPGYLAIHASSAGERRIRLRRPVDVHDAFTGGLIGRRLPEIRSRLSFAETKVWRLSGS